MIPSWVEQYVGLPFEHHGRGPAFDCWGLARHVLRKEFFISAPDFGDLYLHDNDKVGIPAAFATGTSDGWIRNSEGLPGDVVIFNIAGRPMHCGIVVAPAWMLHARPNTGSCLESYDRPQWANRIEGFYRVAINCKPGSTDRQASSSAD